MIPAGILLACAIVALPVHDPRRRLAIRRTRRVRGLRVDPRVAVAALSVAVALTVGLHVGITVAILAGTIAVRRARTARRTTARRDDDTLVAVLDTVVAELRVGAHPATACRAAAAEHPGRVGTVFASAAARAELGGAMSDSLAADADPRVAAVWRVAENHGLGLAALLDAVRTDIRARIRSGRRIDASMAGPRATATVLAALPGVGILLGQAMGAAPLAVLTRGGTGGIMLIVGVTLACAGLLWSDSIVARVAQ